MVELDCVDIFDLIPIVPPSLPGERSSELTSAQRFGAGVATSLFPTVNFLVVLLAGFARDFTVALIAMPLGSATAAFVLSRRLATPVAWAIVIAMGCAAACLVGNGFALLLHGMAQFFHDF